MAAAPQQAAPQVPKKKFFTVKTLLIILIILLFLTGLGVGGYMYLKASLAGANKAGPDPEKLVTFSMGSLLVNLADAGGSNFMRLTPVLEYEANKENKKLGEELSKNKVVLQDCIIRVIRKKKLADVQPPDSIDKVAAELKDEINKNLHYGQIHRVYFSEYLTQ
ncbi:flagellar basal body-associated FliL family protein [Desulforamulus hydrothermalis]|uniref:Flagellar protein FliL n=1 Tax=Desulforamulus hydrothermalis Lam5 = DSM 18033 TaxID=1121428 RepID=K8EBU7_9FIRM|nr:flagellar basal body-associated FliL family protein [Desulforamulus hydrothermalis]CCO09173.1 Flagellar basal body-associated protein FliL (modular protein) [Desulforamulus hydrothermalis Lam5 = DSM 18033]SHH11302.1 flagellar FliL protein [Desulforamulus hydrothermalis Lam5 = DSM 18033]